MRMIFIMTHPVLSSLHSMRMKRLGFDIDSHWQEMKLQSLTFNLNCKLRHMKPESRSNFNIMYLDCYYAESLCWWFPGWFEIETWDSRFLSRQGRALCLTHVLDQAPPQPPPSVHLDSWPSHLLLSLLPFHNHFISVILTTFVEGFKLGTYILSYSKLKICE